MLKYLWAMTYLDWFLDCWNNCPIVCGKDDQICPGYEDEYSGCKMADTCQSSNSKFCLQILTNDKVTYEPEF